MSYILTTEKLDGLAELHTWLGFPWYSHCCPFSLQNPIQATTLTSAVLSPLSPLVCDRFSDFTSFHGPFVWGSVGQLHCRMSLGLCLPGIFLTVETGLVCLWGKKTEGVKYPSPPIKPEIQDHLAWQCLPSSQETAFKVTCFSSRETISLYMLHLFGKQNKTKHKMFFRDNGTESCLCLAEMLYPRATTRGKHQNNEREPSAFYSRAVKGRNIKNDKTRNWRNGKRQTRPRQCFLTSYSTFNEHLQSHNLYSVPM